MIFCNRQSSVGRFGAEITLLLLLAAVIGTIVVLAWVPPVSRDALTHHLAVPKLYLQNGGIYEIPAIKFSYYPMNLDLLYLVALYFKNDIAAKYLHFAFSLLTAWLIYGYLAKRLDRVWALLGAVFFLSLPVIVKLSITVYVDLGLVFFSTAALMGVFQWIESRYNFKYLLISALCCGLALGTKYNGLLTLLILTILIPLVFIKRSTRWLNLNQPSPRGKAAKIQLKAVGWGAAFCIIALLVFSPWMIRNFIWKGNPIYPLYQNFFTSRNAADTTRPDTAVRTDAAGAIASKPPKTNTGWAPFAIRKMVYKETWWEIALIPVRIFFQGRDDDPRYFDGQLNPFLLLLPLIAFWPLPSIPADVRAEKKMLVFFAALFILYAFFQTDMRIRYIAPAIAPLVILSIFGLHRIHQLLIRQGPRHANIGVAVLAAAVLVFNLPYIIAQFKQVDPCSYISGRLDRDGYITRYRPEYPVISHANDHLAADAKLLGLFMGNRRYYSDRELVFGRNLFLKIVRNADAFTPIRDALQQQGFSHLLIRFDLFNNWTDRQFSAEEKKRLKAFFARDVKQVLSSGGFGLFELVDSRKPS
jgi:4-amino-4-deoxy-L-arabinose transferase-like glycosyltransferase